MRLFWGPRQQPCFFPPVPYLPSPCMHCMPNTSICCSQWHSPGSVYCLPANKESIWISQCKNGLINPGISPTFCYVRLGVGLRVGHSLWGFLEVSLGSSQALPPLSNNPFRNSNGGRHISTSWPWLSGKTPDSSPTQTISTPGPPSANLLLPSSPKIFRIIKGSPEWAKVLGWMK